MVPLTFDLVEQVVAAFAELFVGHACHFGRLAAGCFTRPEPGEHLHQGEIGYLFAGELFHWFEEESHFEFGIGESSRLRYLFQGCFVKSKTGIYRRIVPGGRFQVIGKAVGRLCL